MKEATTWHPDFLPRGDMSLEHVKVILKELARRTLKKKDFHGFNDLKAYQAGIKCARNGPNADNCNLIFFSDEAFLISWQCGFESGLSDTSSESSMRNTFKHISKLLYGLSDEQAEQLDKDLFKNLESIKPEDAYQAGFDCATSDPNKTNCHYAFFASEKLMKAWSDGFKAGCKEQPNEKKQ